MIIQEVDKMTEEQIKYICKMAVEKSNRPISDLDKELIKQAIDKANSAQEMIISIWTIFNNRQ